MVQVHLDQHKKFISVQGHAANPSGVPGQNIICAAVSAITLTLIEGLENIALEHIKTRVESGLIIISWEKLNDIGSALISTWFLGILRIQEAYGEITII